MKNLRMAYLLFAVVIFMNYPFVNIFAEGKTGFESVVKDFEQAMEQKNSARIIKYLRPEGVLVEKGYPHIDTNQQVKKDTTVSKAKMEALFRKWVQGFSFFDHENHGKEIHCQYSVLPESDDELTLSDDMLIPRLKFKKDEKGYYIYSAFLDNI